MVFFFAFSGNSFRYGSKSSIFVKISPDTGVNHQFSGKIVQIRGTMNGKRQKEAFVGVRRVKIGENRLSPVRENQKTIKIAFPSWGKTRNHRKSAFPHEGKQEISENRLSLTGENKKSSKIAFPSRGKTRNHRKSAFPHGGKQEIIENRFSQLWED